MTLLAGAGFVDFSFHLPIRGFVLCPEAGHTRSTKSASSAEGVRVWVRIWLTGYNSILRTDRCLHSGRISDLNCRKTLAINPGLRPLGLRWPYSVPARPRSL